jgi:hypothetical protein
MPEIAVDIGDQMRASSGTPSPNVILGQPYPARPLPPDFQPEMNPGDAAGIEEHELAIAQNNAYLRNLDAADQYTNVTLANFRASLQWGKIPRDSAPPIPPPGLMVVPVLGEGAAPGSVTGFDPRPLGPPVAPIPVITPPPPVTPPAPASPVSYKVGDKIQNKYGIPAGEPLYLPDGSVWLAIVERLPFGNVALLQRIS